MGAYVDMENDIFDELDANKTAVLWLGALKRGSSGFVQSMVSSRA